MLNDIHMIFLITLWVWYSVLNQHLTWSNVIKRLLKKLVQQDKYFNHSKYFNHLEFNLKIRDCFCNFLTSSSLENSVK